MYQLVWQYFQKRRAASFAVRHVSVAVALGLLLLSSTLGMSIFVASAQSPCSSGDQSHTVVSGDTLSLIAGRYQTTWQSLASYNHISNPNIIYVNQVICIPATNSGGGGGISPTGQEPLKGNGNYFPYGQCTWWANQRYYQLHGVYVPWKTQANAWQWSDRARDFHWQVSTRPSPGAIVDLQPWVQGAYSLGHVAIVEKVLSNGHVLASNLNWGANSSQVTNVEFTPGAGVTFISI